MTASPTNCPACGSPIPEDRIFEGIKICACGWSSSGRKKKEKDRIKSVLVIVTIALLFVLGFIHMVHWGKYSVEVIGLKLNYFMGSGSKSDLYRLAYVCHRRGQLNCTEGAYHAILKRFPDELKALADLAKTQNRNNKVEFSINNYHLYFQRGGNEPHVGYTFAKILGDSGKVDESIQHFKKVISAKPGILQITVTKAYVDMLIRNNRLEAAEKVIKDFRNRSANARNYLTEELEKVKKLLEPEKSS